MHVTKQLLIERNGLRCMLCGKEFKYNDLYWHHIKPKHVSLKRGEHIDNSYENGCLLCSDCHDYVHLFDWQDEEYKALMAQIKENKK